MKQHPGTFVAGVVFVIAGLAYLLEAFDVWDVRPGRLWPILLIAVGVVILASSRFFERGDD
jgi:hypothetical protein